MVDDAFASYFSHLVHIPSLRVLDHFSLVCMISSSRMRLYPMGEAFLRVLWVRSCSSLGSSRLLQFVSFSSASCGLFNLSFHSTRHALPCRYFLARLLAPCCSLQFELFWFIHIVFLFLHYSSACFHSISNNIFFLFLRCSLLFGGATPPLPSAMRINEESTTTTTHTHTHRSA